MTLEEALQMIDTVCAQVQLNRQGHVQLQTAIAVIRSETMDGGDQPKKEAVSSDPESK